jgi:hypothetical protein
MDEAKAVRSLLTRVARRLRLWRALRGVLRSAAAIAGVMLAILLAHHLGFGGDPRGALLLGLAALALVLGLIPALRPMPPGRAAAAVDAACALGERFTTAAEVIGQPGPRERLVVRDAARHGLRVDPQRIPHARVGREGWLAASVVAAVVVLWLLPVAPLAGPGLDRGLGQKPGAVGTEAAAPRLGAGTVAEAPPAGARPQRGLLEALGLPPQNPPSGDGRRPHTASLGGAQRGAERERSPGGGSAEPGVPHGIERPRLPSPVAGPRGPAIPGAPASATGSSQIPATGESRPPSKPAPGIAAREGAGTERPGGAGAGSETAGTGPALGGAGAGRGGADEPSPPSARDVAKDVREAGRPPGSPGGDLADGQAAFGRLPVPSALRNYILRYFEQLHSRERRDKTS